MSTTTTEQVVHDFTSASRRWGHALQRLDRHADDVTYSVLGHSDDSKPRIAVGHFIKVDFASGKQRLLRVETVEYFYDPPDMFKGTVLKGEWSLTEEERKAR